MPRRRDVTLDGSTDALLSRLITLTARKEDFVTECFAAVLQADSRAAQEYWRVVAATLPAAIRARTLARIDTQCRLGNGSSRCDLVLYAGRERVVVEHKLEAAQGPGQLQKYLRLPRSEMTRVALVAADYQTVPRGVLAARRYLKPPTGQDHFLWADLYPLVQRSASRGYEVASATKGLFDRLGLQPAHPFIGELCTTDTARRLRFDARLRAAWEPLLRSLRRTWKSVGSSVRKDRQSEIYITYGPSSTLQRVWLDPFNNPGSLRIRLKTDTRVKRELLLARLSARRSSMPFGRYLTCRAEERSSYAQQFPWSVEVRIPWRTLLARSSRRTMPYSLKKLVLGLITATSGVA